MNPGSPESARTPRRSMDGFVTSRIPEPRPAPLQPAERPVTHERPTQTPKTAQKRPLWRRVLVTIGHIALFIAVMVGAFLVQSAVIGQLFIILYGVSVFLLKLSSRKTFFLVLACVGVVVFASIRSDIMMANTFAMYAFFLLVIATLSLAREVRSEI